MTADVMIAALDAFEAGPNDDHAVSRLYDITDAFEMLPDRARVVPSMFSVMERCGEADLGSPGPLVHCIESLDMEQYLSQLIDSVHRKPSCLSVWMINRILNANVPGSLRERLLESLRSVSTNPAALPTVVKEANDFLQHHSSLG